ncbi:hypothetical protein Cob_v013223 [Colletotrichum orbiculare MAFF 240422]|uniref:Uncharacterized protein n=1 Tax=Colletotrichum orbiculare (strain 104-T / ATCC 96160 / CBS 514.97 / LARS 414 / MAFF 240422) TaxID=1213857 RepID=A0A484F6F3_COLOR|nr:hypothetical protein Cob_v013223 [Colletotrichum orbiculare MAFF 240422]
MLIPSLAQVATVGLAAFATIAQAVPSMSGGVGVREIQGNLETVERTGSEPIAAIGGGDLEKRRNNNNNNNRNRNGNRNRPQTIRVPVAVPPAVAAAARGGNRRPPRRPN